MNHKDVHRFFTAKRLIRDYYRLPLAVLSPPALVDRIVRRDRLRHASPDARAELIAYAEFAQQKYLVGAK